MQRHQVRNVGNAFAYITDCTLATVEHMAYLKSKSKYEYQRQIAIAQTAIDWMIAMGIDFSTTRAKDVVDHYDGKVASWAEKQC